MKSDMLYMEVSSREVWHALCGGVLSGSLACSIWRCPLGKSDMLYMEVSSRKI